MNRYLEIIVAEQALWILKLGNFKKVPLIKTDEGVSWKIYTVNCLAKATSMESPPWFSMSKPVSGISPDVDWDTAIFFAISSRQAACAEAS